MGGRVGRGARLSKIFYKESKSKKKLFFFFLLFVFFLLGVGGGLGEGARV